ncbi:hypothetical protein [Lysobacter sp. Hz 25]|uniref:hypothetical protein n=1 Tax=Lysobacter sp. Hz 25 TaxID=3383698 RepID=UPI0038D4B937
MHPNDTKRPDPILASLPNRILATVEDALSNDECSTDAEMARYLADIGLTDEQARHAVSYRDVYRLNMWIGRHTPIRGNVQVRYNGTTGLYEVA